MSLLRTSRRWKLTAADIPILIVGLAFIAAGLTITWRTDDHPMPLFWASACLTVGAAIALVGIVLRFQLDLEDELDEAKQARLAFEKSMKADVEVISRRVNEVLSSLPVQSSSGKNSAEEQNASLRRELEDARNYVRNLEAELNKPLVRRRRVVNLLEPLNEEKSSPPPKEPEIEEGSRAYSRLIKTLKVVAVVTEFLVCAAAIFAAVLGFEYVLLIKAPGAHQILFATFHHRFHWFPQSPSAVVMHPISSLFSLGEEYLLIVCTLLFLISAFEGPKKLRSALLLICAFVAINALIVFFYWLLGT